MQRVVIRHLSGSKADQVEEFPVDQLKVLTLGRNTDQIIRFDPDKDDLVSRKHARIAREEDQEDRFLITDVGSSHGTYVNKQRIFGTASILPGDMIQLGPGGPEFQFDLQPRPNGMIRPTREIDEVRQTRESATNAGLANPPTKTSVGRATVERMFGQYQHSSRKVLINCAAIMVGVLVIVAGVLVYLNQTTKTELATRYQNLNEQIKVTRDMVNVVNQPTSTTDPTMSPAEIVKKFGQSTIYIEEGWKLIHTKSDKQVYHRYEGDGQYPAYLQIGETYYPWLSLENENNTNRPVGQSITGSGFVVTNDGFVLTNRHVAATWHTRYDFPSKPSMVFSVDRNTLKVQYTPDAKPIASEKLLPLLYQLRETNPWVPVNEKLLVEKRKDGYFVVPKSRFEGRSDWLNVTFPKNKLRAPARLVRVSDQHDVALIKVDVPNSVSKVDIYDSYSESRPGDTITIMGYPGVSPDIFVRTKSQDPFNPSPQLKVVPDLTVTGGLIGKIIRGEAIPKGGDSRDYYSPFGDAFQLTANATGGGNSGGPVFDDRGRVIGIFTSSIIDDAHITFAVPIRFGMDIMGIKPVLE